MSSATDDRQSSAKAAPRASASNPGATPVDSDAPLDIDALQRRETWAVRTWLWSEQDFIQRVLAHFDVPAHERGEFTQEVVHQALAGLPTFEGSSQITTWLYSITRNVVFKANREKRRHQLMAPQDVVGSTVTTREGTASVFPTPDRATERKERTRLVKEAMQRLPASYREVIRLRDLEERSTAEAANEIGITRVNTRVRLHRARKALRDILAPYFASGPIDSSLADRSSCTPLVK
jgi:RNA polymerase sigma-70 factor (ECF subfamily)